MNRQKKRSLARNKQVHYPSQIEVDSGVWISTGPYRKDICGETREEIRMYLAHIIQRYRNQIAIEKAKEIKYKELEEVLILKESK